MATPPEKIYPGDTFTVAYRCLAPPDPDDHFNTDGVPAIPAHAYARLFDRQESVFLPLMGDSERDDATIEDEIVRYTLRPEFTTVPGDYLLYLTVEFPDGETLTVNRRFRVQEFRN